MGYLSPLPIEEVEDDELVELIERADRLGVPDRRLTLILARKPEMAKTTINGLLESHFKGNVDHKLKEAIRVQLARFAEDDYFATLRSKPALEAGLTEEMIEDACGDYEDSAFFSEADKWALRYAEQMFLDASKVDAEFYSEMKKHYSEAEIMELGTFIAVHFGAIKATRPLRLNG